MTSRVFWRSWLISPAMLGGALLASSSALAADGAIVAKVAMDVSEAPLETVITQPPTDEPAIAPSEPMIAAHSESKSGNLTSVETEAAVPISELPGGDSDINGIEPINPYNHNNETNSLESINKVSQLIQDSPQEIDASDAGVIEPSYEDGTDPLEQVTNVSQLRDVSPGDWAFEALRSLVERYGCIAGYPDGTYRGNRAMSRYEFAAGLNACLQQIERLLGSGTGNFATKADLTRRSMPRRSPPRWVPSIPNFTSRPAMLWR